MSVCFIFSLWIVRGPATEHLGAHACVMTSQTVSVSSLVELSCSTLRPTGDARPAFMHPKFYLSGTVVLWARAHMWPQQNGHGEAHGSLS